MVLPDTANPFVHHLEGVAEPRARTAWWATTTLCMDDDIQRRPRLVASSRILPLPLLLRAVYRARLKGGSQVW